MKPPIKQKTKLLAQWRKTKRWRQLGLPGSPPPIELTVQAKAFTGEIGTHYSVRFVPYRTPHQRHLDNWGKKRRYQT